MIFKKWFFKASLAALGFSLLASFSLLRSLAQDRIVLPLVEPVYPPITELDVRKSKAPPFFDPKAGKGSPNSPIPSRFESQQPADAPKRNVGRRGSDRGSSEHPGFRCGYILRNRRLL